MSNKNQIDLDAVKFFYDPHPGYLGAIAPIPDAVKKVADELAGQTMSLREAKAKIQQVASGKIIVRDGCILLQEIGKLPMNIWRVIQYR